ncbi:DsbA family protein [Shimia sp.]|uniref:DsbA family protein n=1 Tax=Shimia sp. TaxID=1954381 RepID=UPI003B8D25EF
MRVLLSLLPFLLLASVSVAHERDLNSRIREYILNNPEVIIEALEVLAAKEQKQALRAKLSNHPELFDEPPILGIGHSDAPIRVIEFFDYKCAPCKAVHPYLETLVESHPKVRIEMRHLPILTPGSERAARFVLAVKTVAGESVYARVHKELWNLRGPLNSARFASIAKGEELDFSTVERVMESEEISQRIAYNRDLAIALGIAGTPAFVTPNSVTVGTVDIEDLKRIWLSQ